jgi:FkbM family methyltransferase
MLKRIAGTLLSSALLGRVLGKLFFRNIPSVNGSGVAITNSSTVNPSIKAQFFFGLYESGEMRFIDRFLKPGEVVIELGASIGVISSFINRHKRPTRLILVEANPNIIKDLKANLSLNHVIDYTLYNKAIGDGAVDVIEFQEGEDNTTGCLCGGNGNGSSSISVPVISLDDIILENAIDKYVLISDIEGAEIFILESKCSLTRCKMFIMELHETEYNGVRVSIAEMKERVRNIGFDIIHEYGPLIAAVNKNYFEINDGFGN